MFRNQYVSLNGTFWALRVKLIRIQHFLNVFVSISCTRHDLLFFRDRIYIIWGLSLRSPLFLYGPKEGHSTKSVPRPACWKACLFFTMIS